LPYRQEVALAPRRANEIPIPNREGEARRFSINNQQSQINNRKLTIPLPQKEEEDGGVDPPPRIQYL
jgi:hypothetical protein